MKLLKRWKLLLALAVQLLAALSPWFAEQYWSLHDSPKFFAVLATFIGTTIALSTMALAFELSDEIKEQMSSGFALLREGMTGRARQLTAAQFYSDFLAGVQHARETVRISYFNKIPPTSYNIPARKEYYRQVHSELKRRPQIVFHRLVRWSEENRDWIQELADSYAGMPNANLAILEDPHNRLLELTSALSVQVIDDREVWFVALDAHEQQGAHRDVFVSDSELARAMSAYHQRLWQMGTAIVKNGIRISELPSPT